jgi:hypothetical protein
MAIISLAYLFFFFCVSEYVHPHTENLSAINKVNTIKTVCFHDNDACERGATLAVYDYADQLEKLYAGQFRSHIIFPRIRHKSSSAHALQRFESRFNVTYYESPQPGGAALPRHAIAVGCDALYMIKSGGMGAAPAYPSSFDCRLPTAVHGVFEFSKHGTTYAVLNPAMTRASRGGKVHEWKRRLVVPHIVKPPPSEVFLSNNVKDLRVVYNISRSALVVCRAGARDTFDISFVHDAVQSLAIRFPREKLQFLFLNTANFVRLEHKKLIETRQITFLKPTVDAIEKEAFFQACDVFLHARKEGETFGLAVAEFSIRNKPVITYGGDTDPTATFHIDVLGNASFLYQNQRDVENIIASFLRDGIPKKNYDAFKQFSPENVRIC